MLRSARRYFIAVALLPAFASFAGAADLRFFDDAALNTVQFVDDQEGWAAGEDGVIWHTIDGGKNWERQHSGVRASLRSMHFLNPFTGWVVGREELPAGGSAGVVLYTADGGLKWRRLLVNAMPGLHVVRFVDANRGYLAGEGADNYPSGVFTTTDGGRTWKPLPGPRATSWQAGDFSTQARRWPGPGTAWRPRSTTTRSTFQTATTWAGERCAGSTLSASMASLSARAGSF